MTVTPSPETLLDLYRTMLLIRRFEEKIIDVYGAQDMKTPVHLYIGQEAIAAGVCAHLRLEDYIFTTHRSHGHCLAKGTPPETLYAEFYGRETGCSRGRGGSMHPADPERGILGTTAIVGGNIPLAVGTALASRMRGQDRVSVAFFGDGASEEGTFHEGLNFAALKHLPVVFVCENNFYATNSPIGRRQPHDHIARKAAGHGIPGVQVEGNDVLAVHEAAGEAVARARRDDGPTLLECRTYRWRGHVGPDCDHEKGCRPRHELEGWMERCPVASFREHLAREGVMTHDVAETMLRELDERLDAAIQEAREAPLPVPEKLISHVYHGTG